MLRRTQGAKHRFIYNLFLLSGLGLTLFLGSAPAFAQRGQPGEVTGTVDQQNSQGQTPQDQGPQYQGPRDRDDRGRPDQGPSNQTVPPQTLTLPAGTVIRLRTNEWLSSDRNVPGDDFSAVLDQPIVVDGWVVARRGQEETGRVSMAIKAGHGSGNSQLGVELRQLTLVDGQQPALQTQLVQTSAGSSNGRNAAIIGTTTGVGAAIGAAADGGTGAALGAIVGGAAGIAGVFSTRRKPTVIAPETVLSFRLQAPLAISTEKSQFAFQPVTQADYNSRPAYGRSQLAYPGAADYPPPPPPPAYYGYPYDYGYPYAYGYYPAPFAFGFYGGYGFGGRFGGFRGGFRR